VSGAWALGRGAGKASARGHRGRKLSEQRRRWEGETRLGDKGGQRTRDPLKLFLLFLTVFRILSDKLCKKYLSLLESTILRF